MIKMLGGNIVIEGELWLIHRKGAAQMDYHYWPTPMMMLGWKTKMEKHWCLPRKGADEMDICPTSMTLKYLQVLSKLRITRDIYSHILTSLYSHISTYIRSLLCCGLMCVVDVLEETSKEPWSVSLCIVFFFTSKSWSSICTCRIVSQSEPY